MCLHTTPAREPQPCCRPSLTPGLAFSPAQNQTERFSPDCTRDRKARATRPRTCSEDPGMAEGAALPSDEGGAATRWMLPKGWDPAPRPGPGETEGRVWEPAPWPAPPPHALQAGLLKPLLASRCTPASDFPSVISSSGALIFCHFGRSGETKRSGAVT